MALQHRVLIVDNYDSYTFNLWQQLAEICGAGCEPVVIRNDQYTWEHVRARLHLFDSVVISPGPGRPDVAGDFGVCADVLRADGQLPVLGVCLGHQGIGMVSGARIEHAPEARHGRLSPVLCDNGVGGLFEGVPSPFNVVRYHSLCIAPDSLPHDALEVIATAQDDHTIMAVRHKHRPQWGVQFHPESICTEHGHRIVANFVRLAGQRTNEATRAEYEALKAEWTIISRRAAPVAALSPLPPPKAIVRFEKAAMPAMSSTEAWFSALYDGGSPGSVWLDSAKVEKGRSRFSYMGSWDSPLGLRATYDMPSKQVTLVRGADAHTWSEDVGDELFLGWLRDRTAPFHTAAALPFDFVGGWIGYLAYELKDECADLLGHASPPIASDTPAASFFLIDRFVAIDHELGEVYTVSVDPQDPAALASVAAKLSVEEIVVANADWRTSTLSRLLATTSAEADSLAHKPVDRTAFRPHLQESSSGSRSLFTLDLNREGYLAGVGECLQAIRDGESYEICLTTKVRAVTPAPIAPYALYRRLRHDNAAPFAAYLCFSDDFAIAGSSPERFVKIRPDGSVEAKPIKGTIRRGATDEEDALLQARLQGSEKDFAENLMIVDLLRNDLGKICQVGSVKVPKLMAIESYTSLHTLVSTVCGSLREGVTAMDCVQKCFPPGSMTGAPKRRTMEILDRLEQHQPRGVYSGALGFFSFNGASDLSVVIRTAVLQGNTITVGAGGAVVALSDPLEEYEEMILKASSVAPTIFELISS